VLDNRVFFRSKLPNVVTWPELLRTMGWWSGSFGKIYHVGEAYGEFRDGWMDSGRSWNEAQMFAPAPESLQLEGRNLTGGVLPWCRWASMAGTDDDQPDGQTAKHASAAIERQTATGRPWLVAAGFHRPHDPFVAPKKYFDLYPLESLPVDRDPENATPAPPLAIPGGAFARSFAQFTDQDRRQYLRSYFAGVSFMDTQVGRLLDSLDRFELWDRTIVIFVGDHGYHLGERGWWNKNTLFDRCCRTPLIIAAPDGQAGSTCESPAELVDLYPTIVDYAELQPPHELAGESLRPRIQQPGRDSGDVTALSLVIRGNNQFGQTARQARWHYVRWSDGSEELYDLSVDREETHNVADRTEFTSVKTELRKRLDAIGPPREPTLVAKPIKELILPGEAFEVAGRPAFILRPDASLRRQPQPWVMYAPTLPGLPDVHEKWMHEQLLAAGVAVAGIDVGESYGSPRGQSLFDSFHREMTERRGLARKPCLLGRSRGGLWVTAWAASRVDRVAGLAGIYPVFDLRTYPGLDKAAPAYELPVEELSRREGEFNPIRRVDQLAAAKIRTFIIHGDEDIVVPLRENSAEFAARYGANDAGDSVKLIVAKGQGHNYWEGFFHCQELIDFVIRRAKAGTE
jgi:arylsulfatase A-like enzyme